MEKRLLTACLLSAAIILGWQFAVTRLYPPQPTAPSASAPVPSAPDTTATVPQSGVALPVAPMGTETERLVTVETSHWVARFTTRGAAPVSWQLLKGPEDRSILAADGSPLELIAQQEVERTGLPFRVATAGDDKRLGEVTYRAETNGKAAGERLEIPDGQTADLTFTTVDPTTNQTIAKQFTFTGGLYDFGLKVTSTDPNQPLAVVVGPRIGDQSVKVEGSYTHTPSHGVVADVAGKVKTVAGSDVADGTAKTLEGSARWVGVTDNYFAMAVARPGSEAAPAVATNVKAMIEGGGKNPHDFLSLAIPVRSGAPLYGFVGPKDPTILAGVDERARQAIGEAVEFDDLINYGFFARIVRPLIPLIDSAVRAAYAVTHNYGWAIILITAAVNLLFFPLKYRSTVAMKRAAKMQPKMKELQAKMKKYKADDPEYKQLQVEQMQLMREGNPLGGCLPLLLQLPIFWSFLIYFTTSFVVRQQPFIGWVHDLSSSDPYYLLPILMCAAQIGSTMITPMPNSDDPGQKMQRQIMTWVMPVIFAVFFFASAPSGLMLYWMTSNLVGIAIQFAINRMIPKDPTDDTTIKSGTGGKNKGAQRRPGDKTPRELVGSAK